MPTSTQDPSDSRNGWTLCLLFLAALQILVFWMAGYSEGNLDDKAVHYYSAARMFAAADKSASLEAAEPAWVGKLPSKRQFRTVNRLHSYAVYPVYGTLLRTVCTAWPGKNPPYSYSIPVKISFLLLFLFALGWLITVTAAHPVDGVLTAACLLLAGLGVAVPIFAPAASSAMGFLAYAPRGSATLLILAAFVCFARGQGWLAGVSLLLALGWHAGFALVAVPCALGAFAVTLCDRAGSQYARIMGAVLTLVLSLLFVHLTPGPALQYPVWIPAGLVILFLLAGPKVIINPFWRATASLSAFLFLTLGVDAALGYAPFREWLIQVTGNPLLAEIPSRLSGIRHLAGLALTLTVTVGLANRILPSRLEFRLQRSLLLSAATLGLILCVGAGMAQWPLAGRKAALFLHAEEGLHARPVPTAAALNTLDPRQEAAFFAALGDYLLAPTKP